MRIKLTGITVDDQEKALYFYTQKLGFEVKQDAAYGPDSRWLTVVSPEDRDGVELLLEKAVDDEVDSKEFQEKLYKAEKPVLSIAVDDLEATYKDLSDKGVVFTMAPTKQPYGGFDAVLDDGCGNFINLHQE